MSLASPGGSVLPAKWSCGVCTFQNHKSVGNCSVCQSGERPIAYDLAMANAMNSSSTSKIEMATDAAPTATDTDGNPAETAPVAAATSKPVVAAAPAPPKRKRRRAARKALSAINSSNDTSSGPAPSASHYVGYVEEGETVDMIMRKFAQLEEYKKEKRQKTSDGSIDGSGSGSIDQGNDVSDKTDAMNEEDLNEMFARTSNFTMKNAQKTEDEEQREMLAREQSSRTSGGDGMLWQNASSLINLHRDDAETGDYFWDGEVDEDDFWDEVYSGTHKRRKKKQARVKGTRVKRSHGANVNIAFVSDANGKYVTALRRVRGKERKQTEYVRVPSLKVADRRWGAADPKVPFSWAKQIRDYVPPGKIPQSSYVSSHTNLIDAMSDADKMNPLVGLESGSEHKYLAVMMTPPWKANKNSVLGLGNSISTSNASTSTSTSDDSASDAQQEKRYEPTDLIKLPFNKPEWKSLVFAFVWVRKDLISKVIDAMGELNFYYVENLCWIKQKVNNTFYTQPSPYILTTHETLLMFRRGTPKKHLSVGVSGQIAWDPVEMRHQRTEDVCFDFVRPLAGSQNDEAKPDNFCYNMVERLLPHSVHEEIEGAAVDGNGGEGTRLGKVKDTRPIRERGQLIHLWSENKRRLGWTMLHENQ